MLSSALFRSTTLVGCCCSSSKRSFVKDVYKELNYVAPFSQEEKTLVVEKINSARSGDDLIVLGIPRGSAVQIAKHLASQGPLEVLEQLLDVRRFHPEILENVTRTVIRNNSLSGQQDGLGSHLPPNKCTHDCCLQMALLCQSYRVSLQTFVPGTLRPFGHRSSSRSLPR